MPRCKSVGSVIVGGTFHDGRSDNSAMLGLRQSIWFGPSQGNPAGGLCGLSISAGLVRNSGRFGGRLVPEPAAQRSLRFLNSKHRVSSHKRLNDGSARISLLRRPSLVRADGGSETAPRSLGVLGTLTSIRRVLKLRQIAEGKSPSCLPRAHTP